MRRRPGSLQDGQAPEGSRSPWKHAGQRAMKGSYARRPGWMNGGGPGQVEGGASPSPRRSSASPRAGRTRTGCSRRRPSPVPRGCRRAGRGPNRLPSRRARTTRTPPAAPTRAAGAAARRPTSRAPGQRLRGQITCVRTGMVDDLARETHRLHRLLGGLMGDEAGPLVVARLRQRRRGLQVLFGLRQPIPGTVCHFGHYRAPTPTAWSLRRSGAQRRAGARPPLPRRECARPAVLPIAGPPLESCDEIRRRSRSAPGLDRGARPPRGRSSRRRD